MSDNRQLNHIDVTYRVPTHAGMLIVSLVLFAAAGSLISIVFGALKITGALSITWWEVLMPIIAIVAFFVFFSIVTMLGVGFYVLTLALIYKTREWKQNGCRLGR